MSPFKLASIIFMTIGFIFLSLFIGMGILNQNFWDKSNLVNFILTLIFLPNGILLFKISIDPEVRGELKKNVYEYTEVGSSIPKRKTKVPRKYNLLMVGQMFVTISIAFIIGALQIPVNKGRYGALIPSIIILVIGVPVYFLGIRSLFIKDKKEREEKSTNWSSILGIIIAGIIILPVGLLGLVSFIKGISDRNTGMAIFGGVILVIIIILSWVIKIAINKKRSRR